MWLVDMFTTRNVGAIDRVIRLAPAATVAGLWWNGTIGSTLAIAVAVPAAMLVATSFMGSCSIYYTFGLSTLRRQPKKTPAERSA